MKISRLKELQKLLGLFNNYEGKTKVILVDSRDIPIAKLNNALDELAYINQRRKEILKLLKEYEDI